MDTSKLPEYISIRINNYNKPNSSNKSDLRKPVIEIKEIILGPNFDNQNLLEMIKEKYPKIRTRKSNLKGIYKA